MVGFVDSPSSYVIALTSSWSRSFFIYEDCPGREHVRVVNTLPYFGDLVWFTHGSTLTVGSLDDILGEMDEKTRLNCLGAGCIKQL